MMLDNKNEQKWPLTEKEVLKKNKQSRVISFAVQAPERQKTKEQPTGRPTYLSYHSRKRKSTFDLLKKCDFGVLHQRNGTFLDIFPSWKDTDAVLFYRYKKESSPKRIFIKTKAFQTIFRLYKLSDKQNECTGGVQISSCESLVKPYRNAR